MRSGACGLLFWLILLAGSSQALETDLVGRAEFSLLDGSQAVLSIRHDPLAGETKLILDRSGGRLAAPERVWLPLTLGEAHALIRLGRCLAAKIGELSPGESREELVAQTDGMRLSLGSVCNHEGSYLLLSFTKVAGLKPISTTIGLHEGELESFLRMLKALETQLTANEEREQLRRETP